MLKKIFLLLLLCLLSLTSSRLCFGQNFPTPVGYVNDFANILSENTIQDLETKLANFENQTTIEVSVVTTNSLEEITIEDYTVRLFENWQIGKKEKDNGVLLLVAPLLREVRIEVGYGLEPVLTDSIAGRIIRNSIVPHFKNDDFDKGVTKGVEDIIATASGKEIEYANTGTESGGSLIQYLIAGTIFLSYLTSFLARSKAVWPGGLIGAVLGVGIGLLFLDSLLPGVMLAFVLGIIGLVLDIILSRNYKARKSAGLPTSWTGSGGGFFGGGTKSSGGFGGFGGGSSGGGGASGKW